MGGPVHPQIPVTRSGCDSGQLSPNSEMGMAAVQSEASLPCGAKRCSSTRSPNTGAKFGPARPARSDGTAGDLSPLVPLRSRERGIRVRCPPASEFGLIISRIEPLNCSSRRKEAPKSSARNSLSLLSSAATRFRARRKASGYTPWRDDRPSRNVAGYEKNPVFSRPGHPSLHHRMHFPGR